MFILSKERDEVKEMTYMKPEMEIEKFDLIEEITAGETSAAAGGEGGSGETASNDTVIVDESIGNDLIIG